MIYNPKFWIQVDHYVWKLRRFEWAARVHDWILDVLWDLRTLDPVAYIKGMAYTAEGAEIAPISLVTIQFDIRVKGTRTDAALTECIRREGLMHPISVDRNYVIRSGARRYFSCLDLGWEEIPVIVWRHLG